MRCVRLLEQWDWLHDHQKGCYRLPRLPGPTLSLPSTS